MKMLFCNIGWMDLYDGIYGDRIYGGGAFNKKNIGHEVCNFSRAHGCVYGYVRPPGKEKKGGKEIGIKRLGVGKEAKSISGVTVVWTALRKDVGPVVVGWYRNATVYRKLQPMPENAERHKKNGLMSYRITASFNDATLLPPSERNCKIPRAKDEKGGMGQSNIWYADSPKGKETIVAVNRLIVKNILDKLPDIDAGKEGKPRLVLHLSRERNQKLVKAKKEYALRTNRKLSCEVCGFDFAKVYDEVGEGFCEVHHLTPLAQADGEGETTLEDLAIVCSNCHRMLHRGKPIFTIEELQSRLRRP